VARHAHSERNNLDWTIRRVWLPEGLRPVGMRQMHSGTHAPNEYAGLGVLISPLFTVLFGIPALLVLTPLRFAKLVAWRIEAVARPWGRRGPATLHAWRVKGWAESEQAITEIAAALERGETSPQPSGAERDDD
jgi:hypothetical protein